MPGIRVCQRHDGLKQEVQSTFLHRGADFGNPVHFAASLGHLRVARFVKVNPVASAVFGRIAGDVRSTHQFGGGTRVPVDRYNTDTDADFEAAVRVEKTEIAHRATYVFRNSNCLLGTAMVKQNTELVTAQTRQNVRFTHLRLQQGS